MMPVGGNYMGDGLHAAQRLHTLLSGRFWNGKEYAGPDPGVRLNMRFWRFVKSYLESLPWNDDYYYLQAQGYWVINNWKLHDLLGRQEMAGMAIKCAYGILERQRPEGYWDYPSPEWAGRIGTVEGTWAANGMLASYERIREDPLKEGVIKWYRFLINEIGFQASDAGIGINYFANKDRGIVPNNSTLVLAFFGKLSQVMDDEQYLKFCPGLISFLSSSQRDNGELPYVVESPLGKGRAHYQCYQYSAFQVLDLAEYFECTGDSSVLPLMKRLAEFISLGVNGDGSTEYACYNKYTHVLYHSAAVAAALCKARGLNVGNWLGAEDLAYRHVLTNQKRDGGFAFSSGDYYFLQDRRYYPRYLAMILYHLLIKAGESSDQTRTRGKPE